MTRTLSTLSLCAALAACAGSAGAASSVTLSSVSTDGVGEALGTVTFEQTEYGLVLKPDLQGLAPGLHGFHLHENGSCEPADKNGTTVAAAAAGSHYDPKGTGQHGTPWGNGHLGDLPPLFVADDGTASHAVLAPRLTKQDLKGRALMIHAGGDNFSDTPKKLGGGGSRVACGVIS
ncbi:superoxide dismutase family protein [Abyssibacter profundi]|uniref:Superoxide dismutase [Cu-Zn] n=1 Tax=Abyssibacter profundi TaxID=2182787 RepID=A0A363UJU4_9GAMM|nr:superoxide dismutase family protein [Abyssibacter profundi]MBV60463.1 superoxide dismutase [Cu-Zn] SodC2 [Nevskiales bacterium]PWN55698.1 superoxide dismutase [Cu-Zn] SodC2 [Abyssibacter profundi]